MCNSGPDKFFDSSIGCDMTVPLPQLSTCKHRLFNHQRHLNSLDPFLSPSLPLAPHPTTVSPLSCLQRLPSFTRTSWSEERTRGRLCCGTTGATRGRPCRGRRCRPPPTRYRRNGADLPGLSLWRFELRPFKNQLLPRLPAAPGLLRERRGHPERQ